MTGSLAARGMVGLLHTVRATLVPSTRTCSTARWSLSVANMATDNSGMTLFPTTLSTTSQLTLLAGAASYRLLAAARRAS